MTIADPPRMKRIYTATLQCMHCGREPETLAKRQNEPHLISTRPIEYFPTLRCDRCGGPVVIHETDVHLVDTRPVQIDEDDKPRKGRPTAKMIAARKQRESERLAFWREQEKIDELQTGIAADPGR